MATAAITLTCFAGCGGPSTSSATLEVRDPEAWNAAREQLQALRAEAPSSPYVVRVHVTMHSIRANKTFSGRGAIAVSPGRAVRMLLVGPGGGTAFDFWATPSKWKLAIPPLEKNFSGDRDPPPEQSLPVSFFRWWFLSPLPGKMIAGSAKAGTLSLVLRDEGTTIELHDHVQDAKHRLQATRTTAGVTERIDGVFASLFPNKGDKSVYAAPALGLRVEVEVEERETAAPDPHAFDEPEEGGP